MVDTLSPISGPLCSFGLSSFKRVNPLREFNAYIGTDIRVDERITESPAEPPRLLDLVRDAIRRRHYSPRTEETYVHWIKRFIYFHGKRHPRDMGETEATAFLNYLARSGSRGIDPKSGALGDPFSLQGSAGNTARLARRIGESPASDSDAERAVARGSTEAARISMERAGSCKPALRRRPEAARMPEAAGEGRGLRLPADPGARRKGREGPRNDAARLRHRATAWSREDQTPRLDAGLSFFIFTIRSLQS